MKIKFPMTDRACNFVCELMASLEVDAETGCMYLPGKKGRRAKETYQGIWQFVTGTPYPKRSDPGEWMVLAHNCFRGQLGCCNFAHIEKKSHKDNKNDPDCAGNAHYSRVRPDCMARGSNNGNVKVVFTLEMCQEIFDLRSQGKTLKEISKKFKVSGFMIWKILKGKHWSQKKEVIA